MSELELSELIRKFQAIQRQDIPNQITERNVVEIVNVLQRKKFVDLLFTVDGKEYLTWDQLRREVIDEVHANGGRMNVTDLPGLLTVHMIHIERVLPEVLEEPNIRLEAAELMTDEYLDSTVSAAQDVLKEKGFVAVSEFARIHRFTSLFTQNLLTGAVESGRLRAVLQGGALHTKQFVGAQKVVLRAGLLAATEPVNLTTFFERHNLFAPLVDVLIEAVRNDLPGKIEGRVYIPTYFEQDRANEVENVYLSNGFIEYALLHRKGITQAREFLSTKYNPVMEATAQGDAPKRRTRRVQAASTANTESPSVARSEKYPNAGHALSACFLSDRFLANLVVLEDLAHGDALVVDLSTHLPLSVDFEKDSDILLRRLRELHPIVTSCTLLDCGVLLHESVLPTVKKRLESSYDLQIRESGAKGRKSKVSREFGEEEEEILLRAVADVTGLPLEQYQDVLAELTSEWKVVAQEVYSELAAAAEQHVSVDWKRMRTNLQSSLGTAWCGMVIAEKGVLWATTKFDETSCVALNRHLLTDRAFALLRDILLNEGLDSAGVYECVCEALMVKEDQQKQQPPTAALLQKALKALPEQQRQSLSPLVDAAMGKSVETFTKLLRDMSCTAQIAVSGFHQLNKKVERETLASMKQEVKKRVEEDTFTTDTARSGALFALLCSLLIHSRFHVHVDLPGRAVGGAVTCLAAEAMGVAELLKECNQIITGAISGKHSLSDDDVEKLETLRRLVLEDA
ncbi:Uncharacterized conserved protein (DUF2042), putative [Trypanosoma equiperdum]|uniref:Uncharacterized conserved protein (DUF2042), putative n=1 Tax=Trypanosoma equiperdum TaxID=5694 RepID=A0A1G4ID01_TRYEQ|nr:Uncharacterized conserved protein (DUF2042), putative [Trypanosoma equiperdum]